MFYAHIRTEEEGAVRQLLVKLMDTESDSLRLYYLGNTYQTKIEHFGTKAGYEAEGVLIL